MKPLFWSAPAKLNLFLHITGRRDDGYHELQTVFQLIEAADEVRLSVREDGEIRRLSGLPGVAPEADLGVRAARLLKEASGTPLGVDIAVTKRLPMGGGLGGGSSDAATVLVATNALWGLGWSRADLARLGTALGADVPVFVAGRTAWGEGIGERLAPVALASCWFLVVTPDCHVSTAEVFQDPELTRDAEPLKMLRFFPDGATMAVADLMAATRNDCEPLVRRRYPEVAEALRRLGEFGPARLTGTGASVFLAAESEHHARAVARRLPSRWRIMVTRSLAHSPLGDG
ncbi:MAG: 4-(cytidine 5'-diphospho)-2-C-methyl-D-erythritol kinase [Gammaproteobacteria bacterium]|nr:4-(cytidine 5'-diphospho)-2-C-methyl-D-erythritol kinase [Gammaproteobacteria bacterium]